MPPPSKRSVTSRASLILLLNLASSVTSDTGFDIQAALHYLPSKAVAAIGFVVYFIISSLLLWRLVHNRDWWALCLPIGGYFESLGFLTRIFISEPKLRTSLGYYITMDLFIVLAPATFLAFNYIVYGRLIRFCVGREHSYIRPEIVGRTFVLSDIFTFLVQGAGGSMQVQTGTATAGRNIFLIGIIAQGVSYVLYDFFVASSHLSIRKTIRGKGFDPHKEAWWKIFKLIYFSSVFIIIRSIYRVLETALGESGYLLTHEWCFLVFDSIPLAIAISIYAVYWPGNYIPKESVVDSLSHRPGSGQVTETFPMTALPASRAPRQTST